MRRISLTKMISILVTLTVLISGGKCVLANEIEDVELLDEPMIEDSADADAENNIGNSEIEDEPIIEVFLIIISGIIF